MIFKTWSYFYTIFRVVSGNTRVLYLLLPINSCGLASQNACRCFPCGGLLYLFIYFLCINSIYTQKNIFKFLLNRTEIRLYIPSTDWFGSKRTSVWIQINRKMVNTIWFRVDSVRLQKVFSVCRHLPELDAAWLPILCNEGIVKIVLCRNLIGHISIYEQSCIYLEIK